MDPLTQGLIGAVAAQATFGGRVPRAWVIGMMAGMAPDLDVLIKSSEDPLLAVEFHRHFTHALAFIPIGGLLCTLPWLLFRSYRKIWLAVFGAATVGLATHGLLDACTSYGTQLLWPFSSTRVAWHWISIIDPVFTVILLTGLIWSCVRGRRRAAVIGLSLAVAYIGLGAIQRERAIQAQQEMAAARGQQLNRGEVFPTLGNNIVWRSLYQSGDRFYADRIRVAWFGSAQWTAGAVVDQVTIENLTDAERSNPRVEQDFARFSWFADGWVARPENDLSVFGDVRYSLRTNAFDPIWGVRFHPDQKNPTEWVNRTGERELRLSNLWDEIVGKESDAKD